MRLEVLLRELFLANKKLREDWGSVCFQKQTDSQCRRAPSFSVIQTLTGSSCDKELFQTVVGSDVPTLPELVGFGSEYSHLRSFYNTI